MALLSLGAALYVPYVFDDLAFRVGNPLRQDVIMGTIMVIVILEATRRSVGPTLSIIAMLFILYGVFGQYAPGVLVHPGASWTNLINHLYLTSQGIYGIAVGVVATYVFHFVLFGVLATRIGLGALFIELASCVAGRFSGGPAKVSIFSSALFGMISGSSIANTVTTGALTIPAMKRIGYAPHFAAAVEATASTGGQITPPIMGAAAFIMVEFLELPYTTILLAAMMPALMHYLGVLTMVHLEAKRLGLRGLTKEEMPVFSRVIREKWLTLVPLVVLIGIIINGNTPYLAAFWGITGCIAVGFIQRANRLTFRDLLDAFQLGARYALAVGAAAAAVGIIVGVVTLTGMGFRVSYMVTNAAAQFGGQIAAWVPASLVTQADLTLLLTLVFTAGACIIMGAGIPTTATYIILVSIASPALGILGIAPIVAHFFVFYYGVLADITPPVAPGRVRRGRHRRGQSLQGRQYGLPPGRRQGPGSLCIRLLTRPVDRDRRFHLAGLHYDHCRLHHRHHRPRGGTHRLPAHPHALDRANDNHHRRALAGGARPENRPGRPAHADPCADRPDYPEKERITAGGRRCPRGRRFGLIPPFPRSPQA